MYVVVKFTHGLRVIEPASSKKQENERFLEYKKASYVQNIVVYGNPWVT